MTSPVHSQAVNCESQVTLSNKSQVSGDFLKLTNQIMDYLNHILPGWSNSKYGGGRSNSRVVQLLIRTLCSGPFHTQLIHFFYIPSYVWTTCTQDFWILITWLPKSGLAKTRLAGPVSPPLKYQCLGLLSYLVYVDNCHSWQSCDCMRSHDGHVTVWDHMTVMWLYES